MVSVNEVNTLQEQMLERPARIEALLKQLAGELDGYAADVAKADRKAYHRGAARGREFSDAFELQSTLGLDKLQGVIARRLCELGHTGLVQRPQMPARIGDAWVASFERFIRHHVAE